MRRVRMTVLQSSCRSMNCCAGDSCLVGEGSPPICCELWREAEARVRALQCSAAPELAVFTVGCPDGARITLRCEAVGEELPPLD